MPTGVYKRKPLTKEHKEKISKARKGYVPWNKGLTKETDERVARNAENVVKAITRKGKTYEELYGVEKANNIKRKKSIPRETRSCRCGCGGTFICKKTSDQRFLPHHGIRCPDKVSRKLPKELRSCSTCGKTFKCKITSTQKFCSRNCVSKGRKTTQETRDKLSKANIGKKLTQATKDKIRKSTKENWKDSAYIKKQSKSRKEVWKDPVCKDRRIKAIMAGSKRTPNDCERCLFSIVDKLFPGEYKLNTKGEYTRPAGKCPDIVNLKDKKLIEHYGDLWHANKEYCDFKGITEVEGTLVENIRRNDKKRLDSIKKVGWKCLVIWEHELKDIESLELKIKEFAA